MEQKYDLSDNYFKYFNEAQGANILKKKLLKKPNKKIQRWTTNLYRTIFKYVIVLSIFLFASAIYGNTNLVELSLFLLCGIAILFPITFLYFYYFSKKDLNSKKGTLMITKEGIIDNAENGLKIEANYDTLDLVIITKNLIVFSLKYPLFIFIKKENEEQIIKELKKYTNVPIINSQK